MDKLKIKITFDGKVIHQTEIVTVAKSRKELEPVIEAIKKSLVIDVLHQIK